MQPRRRGAVPPRGNRGAIRGAGIARLTRGPRRLTQLTTLIGPVRGTLRGERREREVSVRAS
jgi:hypothetical protein